MPGLHGWLSASARFSRGCAAAVPYTAHVEYSSRRMAETAFRPYHTGMENIMVNKRKLSVNDWLLDAAIALGAMLFGCAQLVLASGQTLFFDDTFRAMSGLRETTPYWGAFFVLGLTTLPLVLRRKFSWPVYLFIMTVFFASQYQMGGYSVSLIGPIVAQFTIACERGRYETLSSGIISVLLICLMPMEARSTTLELFLRLQDICYLMAALLAGVALRSYRRYVHEMEQRALEAERGREEEAARRVEAERVRIAREIHDITAHSLSAVSIQAAAAERVIDKDPELAKESIRTIRTTSKSALEEIRSMIGVLRGEGEAAEDAPTNGTERLGDLVDYLRDAGIEVTCDQVGYHRAEVPLYIDVALFGIAREAVTNIVRHAEAKHVEIKLASNDGEATLSVSDDGKGSGGADGSGHGLQGMGERAQLLKGTFDAHDRKEGGFIVMVNIPLVEKESK